MFELNEQDNFKEIEDLYVFFKLCNEIGLKINFSFQRMVKLMDPVIHTGDYIVQIEASGSEKSIDKLKKLWESMKNDKTVKEELDDLLFHQYLSHLNYLKNIRIL